MIFIGLSMILTSAEAAAGIELLFVKGTVYVRHGVQEQWVQVSPGHRLKPEDSIRSGKRSSAVLLVDGTRKLTVPEEVILDLSDIRTLTPEEFLLKLAMEGVRSAPQTPPGEMIIPRTTTVHGSRYESKRADAVINKEQLSLQLNGTRVLYDNGYFATCVLRSKEVFRLLPELRAGIENRLRVAASLEQMNLPSEALSEYRSIYEQAMSPAQREIVERNIQRLQSLRSR